MTTNTPVPLSPASKTAQRTSVGRRFLGALTRGPYRKFSGSRSHRRLMNKGLAFPVLALLAALAVVLLPGGLLQAQSAEQFFTYTENSTDPVATFTSSDPEGATPGYWSLTDDPVPADESVVSEADIADRALFEIDQSGVLSFMEPRSYEANSVSNDKEYRVTVQVSDGSEIEYFKAYVAVTDMEETGKVTWTVAPTGTADTDDIRLQQFQPGALLTATVTDPDNTTLTGVSRKWYRGSSEITGETGTGATYIVVADDVGNHIRVEATYSDGNGLAETVSSTSENPVQEYRRLEDNMAPVFASTNVTRRVEENSTGNVGGPVTATDGNGDMLTYTLSGNGAASFKIDPGTGQLMVEDNVKLDYEATTSYMVTVTATDSAGNNVDGTVQTVEATVTINVINVDEKPTFDTDSPAGVVAAQTEGMTGIDTNTSNNTLDAAIFMASDPEDEKVTLTLMGDDAGSFELADDPENVNDARQVLSFKEKTDFEMPGDRNEDNVYEVTVRASDGGTLYADRMLIIKVINDAD